MSKELPLHGFGGGASLNFKIIPYVSENALPATAAENTIAVITGTPITSYALSPSEPSTPAEGMVWIATGASSAVAFNLLKRNAVIVCPLSVKQYIDGVWANKVAKSYISGSWLSWMRYLYNEGDDCTAITGGWVAEAKNIGSDGGGAVKPTVTDNGNSVTIKQGSAARGGIYRTVNKIDLTAHSSLIFYGDIASTATLENWCQMCVWSELGTYSLENRAASMSLVDQAVTFAEKVLDVSTLTGEY